MDYVMMVLFGIYLFGISVEDKLRKKIPLAALLSGMIFVPGFMFACTDTGITERVLGLLPGMVLLACGFFSRGGIGTGDAAVVLVLGACLGIAGAVMILSFSFLGIGLVSGVMLALGKLKLKSRLPFVPFLFAGYLMTVITGGI